MQALKGIREFVKTSGAKVQTKGIREGLLASFENDKCFVEACQQASIVHTQLQKSYGSILAGDEKTAIDSVQKGLLQFYERTAVNPYIPIAAKGPWIITSHGAVLYETGGYGMLGLGHAPENLLHTLSQPHVMANIMTPSFSQLTFRESIRREIGHSRGTNANGELCPFESFICLNSGSESVSLAMRIADVDAKRMTSKGGPHNGRKSCLVSLKGSFHGRTERPAHASDSTRATYKRYLKSFDGAEMPLFTVTPNDVQELRAVFEEIDERGLHCELMLIEPCMGEGNPGLCVTREFYDVARELTDKYRSLLLVDSIQAGLRAKGTLSVMDYPGFQSASPPDFETYSKALNGGQFPLSVLALGPRVSEIYARGLYGNTMTTNPRALDIASDLLHGLTPELRRNIVEVGDYFKDALDVKVMGAHPDAVTHNSGSGMLVATHMAQDFKAYGHPRSLEVIAREQGLGVIHGGVNALRYTPNFTMTKPEADLVCDLVKESITTLKEYKAQGVFNH